MYDSSALGRVSLRSILLAMVSATAAWACTTESTPEGSAGSSGIAPTGTGGSGAGSCASTGTGNVTLTLSGLPAGVDGQLRLSGPEGAQTLVRGVTLEGLRAGTYTVNAERVADGDPIVRTLYEPTLGQTELCLTSGGTAQIELSYAAVPTSHRLWTNNSNGTGNLLGFSGALLSASADAEPSVAVTAGAGKDVTFDAQGNLWSMGGTVADPHLMRFARSSLGASGTKTADRGIDLAGVPCIPALRAFAFASDGALWVSTCGGRVSRLGPAELESSGEKTPGVNLSNVTENGDVAFDATGNLWVTAVDGVWRFDAARLGSSSDGAADLSLRVRNADDTQDVTPSNLAFDTSGNLWVIDFGGNLLSRIPSARLAGTGSTSAVSDVTLALAVSALLERPAFDESGGLWLALNENRFGRLTPAQLGVSSSPGAPTTPETIITSPGMGNANRMAFFPAAAQLPLYHHFR
ncbi:MAG: hypothetical protein RL033_1167 [Pseudomonadota bacterium]|jgi:hypothetical protein